MPILFEAIALTIAVVICAASSGGRRLARLMIKAIDAVAKRRGLAVLVIGLLSLLLNIWVATRLEHYPTLHDEFSNLLAADTFANGRLSNPPHPLWRHFEAINVIQQPSYASKYPPGQGMILALGQICFGRPIVGSWIAIALASASICWMLQAWVPLRWAFFGGLLACLHPSLIMYWGQMYFGGALPMLGGALLFGSLRRLIDTRRARHAWMMGAGMLLLSITRPFEGLVASACGAGCLCFFVLVRWRHDWRKSLRCVFAPLACMSAIILSLNGYYNYEVTGNAFIMPYTVHESTYAVAPLFVFQSPADVPNYAHSIIRRLHTEWSLNTFKLQQSWRGYWTALREKAWMLWSFYGVALTVPLVFLPWTLRNRWTAFAAGSLMLVLLALACETYYMPHYSSPVVCLFFVLIVQGVRQLYAIGRNGRFFGRQMVLAISVILLGALAITLGVKRNHHSAVHPETKIYARMKHQILRKLESIDGRHLVLVYYQPSQNIHFDFVHNAADFATAKVLWARPMNDVATKELLRHFDGWKIWRLDADSNASILTRYGEASPTMVFLGRHDVRLAGRNSSRPVPAQSVN